MWKSGCKPVVLTAGSLTTLVRARDLSLTSFRPERLVTTLARPAGSTGSVTLEICGLPLISMLWMLVPKACWTCPAVPLKVMKFEPRAVPVMAKPREVSQAETLARSGPLRPNSAPNCSGVSH